MSIKSKRKKYIFVIFIVTSYEFFPSKTLIRLSQNHRSCHREIWRVYSNLFYDGIKIEKSYIYVTLENYPSCKIWSQKLSFIPKNSKSCWFNSWNQSWKEGTFIILFIKFDLKYSHFIYSTMSELEKSYIYTLVENYILLVTFCKIFQDQIL